MRAASRLRGRGEVAGDALADDILRVYVGAVDGLLSCSEHVVPVPEEVHGLVDPHVGKRLVRPVERAGRGARGGADEVRRELYDAERKVIAPESGGGSGGESRRREGVAGAATRRRSEDELLAFGLRGSVSAGCNGLARDLCGAARRRRQREETGHVRAAHGDGGNA